jgi:uncharacterized membrane protein
MSTLAAMRGRVSNIFPIKKTLWRGIVIVGPIGVVLWIILGVVNAVNTLGDKLITPFFPGRQVTWGIGFLIILFFILVVGRLELYYEGKEKSIWQTFKEKSVGKIPFIGPLFATRNRKVISLQDFKELTPCKFWLSDTTPHYGFIVSEQKVKGADTEIDVYRPNVPTIIPGDLFPLKKRFVIKLGNPSSEILEKLTSCGFIRAEEEIPVPWEDETPEEFHERINLTPLEIATKRILGHSPKDTNLLIK